MMLAINVCTAVVFVFVSVMLQAGSGAIILQVDTDLCNQHADGCNFRFRTDNVVYYFAWVSKHHLKAYRLPTYKEIFAPACNQRDVCYRCGVMYDRSQATCDKDFLSSMTTACAHLNSTMRAGGGVLLCEGAAKYYHQFELEANVERYLNPAADYCNNTYIPYCIP